MVLPAAAVDGGGVLAQPAMNNAVTENNSSANIWVGRGAKKMEKRLGNSIFFAINCLRSVVDENAPLAGQFGYLHDTHLRQLEARYWLSAQTHYEIKDLIII